MENKVQVANRGELAKQNHLPPSRETFKNLLNCSEAEALALELKYKASPIAKMDDVMLITTARLLVKRIYIITGWPIPDLDEDRKLLYVEIAEYLRDQYNHLNADEIIYAIRKHGTNIENWGKNINLQLIGKCLDEYSVERAKASKLEESKKLATIPQVVYTGFQWEQIVEESYQEFLSGRYHIKLWPVEMYDCLVGHGMIAADVYEDLLAEAEALVTSSINQQIDKSRIAGDRSLADQLQDYLRKVVESADPHDEVLKMAKRIAVESLFKKAKEQKFLNLFIQEK